MKKQINYVKSLSEEHKNVLKWYTTDNGYKILNNTLRTNNKKILNKELKDILNLIDNIFLHCPKLEKSIVVYRGLELDDPKDINFTTNSFISTSSDYETSLNFSGKTCCILKINIPSGSKILPLKTIAKDVAHEEEILLDRYCKISATYIHDNKKGVTLIDCVYIPEDSIDIESIKDIKESKIVLSNDKIVDSLLNILGDEIELYDTIEELQIQLEDIAQRMNYKLNKDILENIKHKLNL
jgi:hypothetical protein